MSESTSAQEVLQRIKAYGEKHPHGKESSRTSLHESKAMLRGITRKNKDTNCVEKNPLEWDTDLIETMKLESVIGQATQDVYSDEEQHESREADAHEDLTERDEETQTMAGLCQRRPSSRSVSIPRHT